MIKASRMYRMPEKQTGGGMVSNCARSCFLISMQITYPVAYFPSNWNVTFLPLFNLFPFILYYFCASWILLYATAIHICFASLTLMQITLHPADFTGDKNVAFNFSDACLFGHPFYFWLSRFYKLSFRLFISTF